MVNLKKYPIPLRHFVLFLTFAVFLGCQHQKNYVSHIDGKLIPITQSQPDTDSIENFVKPFREHIDQDLAAVLAYCPETLDKSKGTWQTNIGSFMADVMLQAANTVLRTREGKQADLCLLNHGGIRATIAKGDVTARTAYEVMPFENNLVAVALRGSQVREIAEYIIKEKKPHPLAGMTFVIAKDGTPKDIKIGGKLLDEKQLYLVATSDYLSNGGDNMVFFKKGEATYDLDYKLRNVLIDYFKVMDTLDIPHDTRIGVE